jgi:hypothetical protein
LSSVSSLAVSTITFCLDVSGLEVALGHDGFMRGAPEPVLMFAVWARDGREARMVGREIYRFDVSGPFPRKFPVPKPGPLETRLKHAGALDFLILGAALESDGGHDIGRIYGALEREDRLALWPQPADHVEPLRIVELDRRGQSWSTPTVVDLLVDDQLAAKTCQTDKWIGAVAWGVTPSPELRDRVFRLPFLAPDKRNDWTAFVTVRC